MALRCEVGNRLVFPYEVEKMPELAEEDFAKLRLF
jgi:hypothetical protein